jgi:threonine dehydratase
LKADIFLPSCSPDHKLRQIRAAGANLHVVDGPFAEAASRCADFVAANDALLVHPFEDPAVIAGQGTLGLEILEQSPDVTKVIVAVGGGGLAAGIVIALDGGAEVIAVEPKACPSLAEALRAGMPVAAPVGGIAADSLGAPVIGEVAFSVLAPSVRHAVTLSEKAILDAQQQLWQEFRLAVEPAAACSWAVLESTEVSFAADDCIVVVICGGNVNPQEMAAWASS